MRFIVIILSCLAIDGVSPFVHPRTAPSCRRTPKTLTPSSLERQPCLPQRHKLPLISLPSSALSSVDDDDDDDEGESVGVVQQIASTVSQRAAMKANRPYIQVKSDSDRRRVQLVTLLRVVIPSILAGIGATLAFPALSLFLATIMNDAGVFTVLSQDSSQFVQNFLSVSSLLFSILVGQT